MSERAVLVTGASTGIGLATVEELVRRGFVAYAVVRGQVDAHRLGALDERIRPLVFDVTDRAAIAAAADQVRTAALPLYGVVNNAGVALGGPLEYLPLDTLRRQLEINVIGAMAVTQAFLPFLRETHGRLVFVGSISGRLAVPFVGPYSASKFALRALSDALRLELRAAGVQVSLIEPGSVKTPIWEKARASRQAVLDALPPLAIAHYGPQLENLFASTAEQERTGMPVERVSAAILRALTDRKPRAKYLVGGSARAGSVIAILPDPLRERAVRAAVKLD
ncbi:MAG TPA: SDR family NAD(P)-dependent oxidoreductase [Candidatus Sulfotelmatobacter sp.]|nr:SDR family NAD(P)-dependent oxidoreductase [Candidatus Sulfotelmatobacter sp.]